MVQTEMNMSNEPDISDAFVFPQGIAGFPEASRFGFIYEGVGEMVCMQSVDSPEAAFVLTPWDEDRLGKPPVLKQDQYACLGLESADDVIWMLVLNPFADEQWVTANLKAPIVISEKTRKGMQLIRTETDLQLRYQWMRQPQAAAG